MLGRWSTNINLRFMSVNLQLWLLWGHSLTNKDVQHINGKVTIECVKICVNKALIEQSIPKVLFGLLTINMKFVHLYDTLNV